MSSVGGESSPATERANRNPNCLYAAKRNWKAAVFMVKSLPDPWGKLGFDEVEEETVARHMYNPRNRKWRTDEVVVKMQCKSFAHGAMRECYRMKKLSTFSQNPSWQNASNYVAKRYMKDVDRQTYFDDVKLQMDTKLWGEKYSRMEVPKKVDFCQTYVVEFKDRAGSPLYGVEHFIDGGYVKYNSNSGFVSDVNRLTPQAFSHFTFERSNHQLIIVDIQGVGDLYTDPQMHTVDMKDYGDANLGTKGMALFFSTHICSPLCEMLKLTQFDLNEEEVEKLCSKRWNFSSSTTQISDISQDDDDKTDSCEEEGVSESNSRPGTVRELYRRLSTTINKRPPTLRLPSESEAFTFSLDSPLPLENLDSPLPLETPSPGIQICVSSPQTPYDAPELADQTSLSSSQSALLTEGSGRSASVLTEQTRQREEGREVKGTENNGAGDRLRVLGLIHLDLACYHEMGRFSLDQSTPDLTLSRYHLSKAASCGIREALYTLAHMYLQLPHDDFKTLTIDAGEEHMWKGMEYLVEAAERGAKMAMLEVGTALDTGVGLGKAPADDPTATQRCQNWFEAIKWYRKALEEPDTTSSEADVGLTEQNYSVLARMAEMYRAGGYHLERDPQLAGELYNEAAEAAMNHMKGKLSTKYFMLAEEAWGELEED